MSLFLEVSFELLPLLEFSAGMVGCTEVVDVWTAAMIIPLNSWENRVARFIN